MEFDLVIKGGTIVDGTRLPRYRGDIGVKNGRISAISRNISVPSKRTLNAEGCIVAPGFVDLHTHYDAQIHWDPYCSLSGWHGVTSVVLGNCGFGFAPVKPNERERSMLAMTRNEQIPLQSMVEGMPWRWETFPEWLDNLQNLPKGVNVLAYVPVSPLMIYVMGLEASKSRPATPEERAEMKRLLHEAMDAGACGFSIQRLGERSLQADFDGTPMPTDTMVDEDILALAEVLAERDEGFIEITQSTGGDADEGAGQAGVLSKRDRDFIERLAEVAQRPIINNQIAVVDAAPGLHEHELKWLHECNARGLRIYGQGVSLRTWFNFSLEYWNMYDSSPAWNFATRGSVEERIEKLSNPEIRQQMRDENHLLISIGEACLPENLTITSTPGSPELEKYVGRTIGDIAQEQGKQPVDAMVDIALEGGLRVKFLTQLTTSGDAEMVGALMSDPYVIAGVSDGGAHVKHFTGGVFTTEFLTWLVRDTGQVSLEEAHFHLSYLPAQASGFVDRGFLRQGAPADIIVYDLDNLKITPENEFEIAHDFPANEWRVVQRAEGYRYTIVNGEVTFEDGVCTGKTPGTLLRNRQIAVQPF